MSNLANWFRKHEHSCPSAEIQLFKDFIDGKINPRPAAILLNKNIGMKEEPNGPLYAIVQVIVALAVHSLNTAIQKKIVKLASAIRTIRKHSLNPGNKFHLVYSLVRSMRSLEIGGAASTYVCYWAEETEIRDYEKASRCSTSDGIRRM